MAYTFGDCWRLAMLHAPVPDLLLLRAWTQWAYNQFCDRRGWSNLRAETNISIDNQKSGTCTVVQGSAAVTGDGTLAFVSTDVGRAFRLTSIPIYTIIAVNGGNATLNRAYSEASRTAAAMAAASLSVTVLDAYVTMPEDFHRFISIIDPANKWRLRFWVSQDEVNRWDPGRMSTGNARLLASLGYSPVAANASQPRYELYPFQTTTKTYPVWYYRKPEILTDDTTIVGPLARRAPEVLLNGALSRCARWPGTPTLKNPYFNLSLAGELEKEFEKALAEVVVVDEELYFEALTISDYHYADYPWDAAWLQSHEPAIIG